MRKVLIITTYYYPANIPPSQRIAEACEQFPELGWEPVVLCPKCTASNEPKYYDAELENRQDVCETVRVPFEISFLKSHFNKILHAAAQITGFESLLFHSPCRLYRDMLAQADRLLTEGTFDAILATVPLSFPLGIADKMSRKHGIPWVADFRDVPQEHTAKIAKFSPRQLHIAAHRKASRSASALTSVSQPLVDTLKEWHGKPTFLVRNGFDPKNYHADAKVDPTGFTLAYCGTFYGSASPALLLEALDEILAKEPKALEGFRLKTYGVPKKTFRAAFKERPCSPFIEFNTRVSFSQSIRVMQEATALLFLSYPAVKGVYTAKIFHYLGAGRPILALPGDRGVTDALIEETKAGKIGRTKEEISRILLAWLKEWRSTRSLRYEGIPEKIEPYSREKQIQEMARALDLAAK